MTSSGSLLVDGFSNISDRFIDETDDTSFPKDDVSLLRWYKSPDTTWEKSTSVSEKPDKNGWWKVNEEKELVVAAPAKKDFWRKTYYSPVLVKDDGPCLFATVSTASSPMMVETSFELDPKRQFDQAGICIRIDFEHWIKTGIEVVDGIPRLSCVVTNVYSDWSTQTWHEPKACIRVHIFPNKSMVVEAKACSSNNDEEWSMLRIAHLSDKIAYPSDPLTGHSTVETAWKGPRAPHDCLLVGLFACCPEDQDGSCTVKFSKFTIQEGSTFEHNADGNHE